MKIVLLILLTSCTLLKAEYKRHKIRGPPYPPRVHPSQQFAKKWTQYPPRNPVRARPIPLHMPPTHKIPMGAPPSPKRAVGVAPPLRNFWKNTVKYQPEKPYPPRQEKPFLAAPSINAQEFDYHIQTNSIPTTHTNPIKQVGEKGPIHTIPAPNLSLKDKPAAVREEQQVRYQQVNPYHQIDQNHHYQVTEQPESLPQQKLYRAQHQQLLQQHQLLQQLQQEQLLQKEVHKQVEPQQLYYTTDPVALSQPLPQKTNEGEIYLSSRLNPKELYQIIGAAYQTQAPSPSQEVSNSNTDYQALLAQQLYQPEQSFIQQLQAGEGGEKDLFRPEYQSFNYDEQAHQKSQQGLANKDFTSLVSAGYNLDSNPGETQAISSRNSLDVVAQAQMIQRYFDTRSDVEENDVEPDAKPSQDNSQEKVKEELLGSTYYASLPNKEAAQRLADLQAAGKINSSLMKLSAGSGQAKEPIFVPDEDKEDSSEIYTENSKEQPMEYEEYSGEDGDERNEDFGHRVQSKN